MGGDIKLVDDDEELVGEKKSFGGVEERAD